MEGTSAFMTFFPCRRLLHLKQLLCCGLSLPNCRLLVRLQQIAIGDLIRFKGEFLPFLLLLIFIISFLPLLILILIAQQVDVLFLSL